jgi:hypothetical protein
MIKPLYFHTKEECEKWCQKNMKRLKSTGIIQDRENPILYPEEIVEYFGDHPERYVLHRYRITH